MDRRTALLDAAEQVLTEHGLTAAVADITSRAGVAKGTSYLYLSSKEDIVQAVQARLYDDYVGAAVKATARMEEVGWWRAVEQFVAEFIELDMSHRDWHRLVAQGWSAPAPLTESSQEMQRRRWRRNRAESRFGGDGGCPEAGPDAARRSGRLAVSRWRAGVHVRDGWPDAAELRTRRAQRRAPMVGITLRGLDHDLTLTEYATGSVRDETRGRYSSTPVNNGERRPAAAINGSASTMRAPRCCCRPLAPSPSSSRSRTRSWRSTPPPDRATRDKRSPAGPHPVVSQVPSPPTASELANTSGSARLSPEVSANPHEPPWSSPLSITLW